MTEQTTRQAIDAPWPLPAGWCWVRLSDLGFWTGGGTPSKSNAAFWTDGTIPWVSPKDMKVDIISETEDSITAEAVEESSAKYVAPGSVLMVMRSGILRHSFPVAVTECTVTLNQDLRALTPENFVSGRYIALYLQQANRAILRQCSKDGTTVNSVEFEMLARFPFPLAPLPEQKRIVARIDALFAEIAAGEAALEEARAGLETFRRALLKAAVSGDLTADWRADRARAGKPVGETGADLLARIRAERANAAPRKTRGRRQPAAPADLSALPDLPEGWVWAALSELGEFGRGKSRHRPRDDARLYGGNMPFLQTGVVANSEDYIIKYDQTYSDFGVSQSKLWPNGTLCITIAANIAKTAITTFECCFPDSIVGLIPDARVDAYWVHLWMQTIQSRIERYAPATAQKNINLEVLNAVFVPLPPPEEMTEILSRVTAALEATAETRVLLETEAADAARLRQSVLKAAFEGRLVPQDPADEPAAALLARTRATAPPAPRRGRRKAP